MKQKDIALIILIAAIAALLSFFLSRLIFESGGKHQQKAAVVDAISTEFDAPSSKYFNSKSIDPTQLIQITDNDNNNPFNGKDQ